MRLVAQRVEKQYVQSSQQLQGTRRDLAVVGQIGRVAKTESEDGGVAVPNRNWSETRAQDVERRPVKFVKFELGNISSPVGSVENIGKRAPDDIHRFGRRVDRNM